MDALRFWMLKPRSWKFSSGDYTYSRLITTCYTFYTYSYLYGERLADQTTGILGSLLALGDRYNVSGLVKTCTELLSRKLNATNCISIALVGHMHNSAILKEKV